jgi:RNA polymerase sigma-70 factor (ECF subfamily)
MDHHAASVTATAPCSPVDVDVDPQAMRRLEPHRHELAAHCRRILGSTFEVDDAVQETLVRAWQALDRFEGRSSLRSWLHRIATNVCLDMRRAGQRRARPMDATSWPGTSSRAGPPDVASPIEPMLVGHARSPSADPAEQAVTREAVRSALAVALVGLTPRQRSVLILRDVLRWRAAEVAELLGTTVASVNSALLRARARLAGCDHGAEEFRSLDEGQRASLRRCLVAFERCDHDSLVWLMRSAVAPDRAGGPLASDLRDRNQGAP